MTNVPGRRTDAVSAELLARAEEFAARAVSLRAPSRALAAELAVVRADLDEARRERDAACAEANRLREQLAAVVTAALDAAGIPYESTGTPGSIFITEERT